MNLSTQTQQTTFNFEGSDVRVIKDEKGEPWFLAKDICMILGLTDVSKSCERLDEDDKGTNTFRTLGGNQKMTVVNESGLYSLTFTSTKPEAKKFKKWVTSEVLPSIRKTGSYSVNPVPNLNDAKLLRTLLLDNVNKVIELQEAVAEKDEVIAEQAPKVAALELLSGSEGSLCVRDTANSLGIMPSKLSKWMEANKWAYRKVGKNKDLTPYRSRIQSGILEYEPVAILLNNGTSISKLQMRVTPKGLTKLAVIFSSGAIGDTK